MCVIRSISHRDTTVLRTRRRVRDEKTVWSINVACRFIKKQDTNASSFLFLLVSYPPTQNVSLEAAGRSLKSFVASGGASTISIELLAR